MKDKQIEKAIEKIVDMYSKLENDLLTEIASHFLIEEEFQNSDWWRAKKLQETGSLTQEVIKYLAKISGKTEEEVRKAFEQIGIDTIDLPTLEKAFKKGLMKVNPEYIKNNPTLTRIVNNAIRETSMYLLQLSPKIIEATRKAYLEVIEKAYLMTVTGTHSYSEAIKQAINDLGNKGINAITYITTDDEGNIKGVRRYDTEAAVRRDVLTNARQLNHELTEELIDELQPEYLYLSEHLDCRYTHFPWQGTIIKAEDLVEVTDYGDVAGLGGINCRHYFEPWFGEERGSELKKFTEEECNRQYELKQHQRYLERGIRKWKRKASMFKASGFEEEYDYCNHKVEEWSVRNQTYIDMINDTEYQLKRDFTREQISNK